MDLLDKLKITSDFIQDKINFQSIHKHYQKCQLNQIGDFHSFLGTQIRLPKESIETNPSTQFKFSFHNQKQYRYFTNTTFFGDQLEKMEYPQGYINTYDSAIGGNPEIGQSKLNASKH